MVKLLPAACKPSPYSSTSISSISPAGIELTNSSSSASDGEDDDSKSLPASWVSKNIRSCSRLIAVVGSAFLASSEVRFFVPMVVGKDARIPRTQLLSNGP